MTMKASRIVATSFVLAACLTQAATAQVRLSDFCQANGGNVCTASLAPLGSACRCPPQRPGDSPKAGRVVVRPPNVSNICSSRTGVCRVDYGVTGSACTCGPTDPGRRLSLSK
jgi:hypothetical protein